MNRSVEERLKEFELTPLMPASKAELEEITALYDSVKPCSMGAWDEEYPTPEITLEDFENHALFRCLDSAGRIAAAAVIGWFDEFTEIPNFDHSMKNPCEPGRFCTRRELHHTGAAVVLLDAIVEKAKELGFGGMHFLVYKYNPHLIKMYRRYGFKDKGEYDYYGFESICFEMSLT